MSAPSNLVPLGAILKGGAQSRTKETVRSYVVAAAEVIYDALRPCLGPNGRLKILVDTFGDVTITGDGAAILDELEVEHPIAKVIVESAKAMDKETGDGVVSMTLLSTRLLMNSRDLLATGVHAGLITDVYASCLETAKSELNRLSSKMDPTDRATLARVVRTAMSGYSKEEFREMMMDRIVEAALQVMQTEGGHVSVDLERVKVEKKSGGSFSDTMVIDGVMLDKEIVHPSMPKALKNIRAALLDASLEVQKTEFDEKLRFKDPTMLKDFIASEEKVLRDLVEKVKASGAKAVFCQKGIDDLVQYLLAKEGILAVRRIKKSDMEKLALSTGGRILSTIDELDSSALGAVGAIEERKVGGEKWVFVEGATKGRTVSILLRGPDEKSLEEAEKVLKDGLACAKAVLEEPYVVPGAGAVELDIASSIRKKAAGASGQEVLARKAFAEALEDIPKVLAFNAGLDAYETLSKLTAKHSSGAAKYGVGSLNRPVVDSEAAGVIEPVRIKRNIYATAVETAIAVLRIDQVVSAAKMKPPKAPQGEGY